ncbi:MAG: hypothetical protein ACKOCV_03960 [Gemmatimonadota bacterium]
MTRRSLRALLLALPLLTACDRLRGPAGAGTVIVSTAAALLAEVGFPSARVDARLDTLSSGERQRVAIARARWAPVPTSSSVTNPPPRSTRSGGSRSSRSSSGCAIPEGSPCYSSRTTTPPSPDWPLGCYPCRSAHPPTDA